MEKALQKANSTNLQSQSPTIRGSSEISVYHGRLTKHCLAEQMSVILQAFPKMPKSMLNILKNRFIENNFSDDRMIASVNHVIDTYEGWDKLPNIANFIQYDKTVRVYTYAELREKHKEDYYPGAKIDPVKKYYAMVDIGLSKPRFVERELQEKYKLKLWSKKC